MCRVKIAQGKDGLHLRSKELVRKSTREKKPLWCSWKASGSEKDYLSIVITFLPSLLFWGFFVFCFFFPKTTHSLQIELITPALGANLPVIPHKKQEPKRHILNYDAISNRTAPERANWSSFGVWLETAGGKGKLRCGLTRLS